jgi:hypothetical protein
MVWNGINIFAERSFLSRQLDKAPTVFCYRTSTENVIELDFITKKVKTE